ncbi:insulin-like growth factor-binding protein 1b isoform X2 [Lampris incognitus]|uniref:insulin-like growth factor-binding protein 1b isoform X2 n=1 Tax=Lampris incognitus TaxID=2546036 RepID=UPI0024B5F9A0|nr:insulin-like growth factor-binding protein 1b isoform X2 [Lampris incognitus]
MSGLHGKQMLVAALSLALLAAGRCSPVVGPEPIRCAPCTQDKLSDCPAIPSSCKQVLREPGCGCCMACALEKGASCGVHTAHCAEGLRCTPRPEESRPLHALTRGQGVCTEHQGQDEVDRALEHGPLHYLFGVNAPSDPRDTVEVQESIKAKVNAIRSKLMQQGPCHIELHEALDIIASSQQTQGEKFTNFYLPNCDKHGYYKSKQCESSLTGPPARCWCVSPWNGKRVPGSNDLLGDTECHQELTH